MFRTIANEVWTIDAEWVPDPETGRRVYALAETVSDDDVRQHMWKEGGATEDDPRPYLKTILCRLVAITAFIRRRTDHGVEFDLKSWPSLGEGAQPEAEILSAFLGEVGRIKPQLVGFNLIGADLPIFVQRAMVHGIAAPGYCARPDKPWQGVDYFTRFSTEAVIDLWQIYGASRVTSARLHELATAACIPGKIDASGDDVVAMWKEGKISEIVEYNRYDVLTTYLLWLRSAHLAGHLNTEAFHAEEVEFDRFLEQRIRDGEQHLEKYREAWHAMKR